MRSKKEKPVAVSANWSDPVPLGLIHYMIHYTLMHILYNVEGGTWQFQLEWEGKGVERRGKKG